MWARTMGIAAGMAVALGTSAHAGGFDTPPGFSWTGFYVGGHVGHGNADFDGIFDSGELPGDPEFVVRGSQLDVEGFLGGVQAGYNMQFGMWVVGVEGDVSFMDASDKAFDPDPGPAPDTDNVRANLDTLATLRVRGGPTFGRFFVFGTVGAAWADASWRACDCDANPITRGTIDFDDAGVAYGGGVEVALGDRWSIKGEGLFLNFDDRQNAANLTDDSDPEDFAEFTDVVVWRVGVNYRFGGAHHEVAEEAPPLK